jgi:hypothetical protein
MHLMRRLPCASSTAVRAGVHACLLACVARRYNPVNFNATEMAIQAKAAGMQYAFYTTVHCDGFINWDTKLTDYNIMNTPYARDIFGEVSACIRARVRTCARVCVCACVHARVRAWCARRDFVPLVFGAEMGWLLHAIMVWPADKSLRAWGAAVPIRSDVRNFAADFVIDNSFC